MQKAIRKLLSLILKLLKMSESIFKFKKPDKKKLGGIELDDPHEWTLLIKHQVKDETLFVHFRKKWNLPEAVPEPEPEVTGEEDLEEFQKMIIGAQMAKKDDNTAEPILEMITGFVKDGKFVIAKQQKLSHQLYDGIKKNYVHNLTKFIEDGYVKHEEAYAGDIPIAPKYYVNERTPVKEAFNMTSLMQGQSGPAIKPAVMPTAPPPVKKPKGSLFGNLVRKTTP